LRTMPSTIISGFSSWGNCQKNAGNPRVLAATKARSRRSGHWDDEFESIFLQRREPRRQLFCDGPIGDQQRVLVCLLHRRCGRQTPTRIPYAVVAGVGSHEPLARVLVLYE